MRYRRVLSLALSAVAALALSVSGATDFAFPLQANSVRLAVIGDFGNGEQHQIRILDGRVVEEQVEA